MIDIGKEVDIESLLEYEDIKSILDDSMPAIAVAEEVRKLLEIKSIEDVEDYTGISSERLIRFMSLDGNPTLGEMLLIAKAAGKRLSIDFIAS